MALKMYLLSNSGILGIYVTCQWGKIILMLCEVV